MERISNSGVLRSGWQERLALFSLATYYFGLALPYQTNIPLVALSIVGIALSFLTPSRRFSVLRRTMALPMLALLIALGLATLFSIDIWRSLSLSTAFLPGILLLLIIGTALSNSDSVTNLTAILSFLSGLLALMLLVTIVTSPSQVPAHWLDEFTVGIFIVPNDVTMLALLAPFSLVTALSSPRSMLGISSVVWLCLSVVVIIAMQSRTATLALVLSVTVTVAIIRPRLVVPILVVGLIFSLLIDAIYGFVLTRKFTRFLDSRLSVWWVAWSSFIDSPFLGQGPHTFALFYPSYIEEVAIEWRPTDSRNMPWAHNLFLEMLSEWGVLGFLSLVWLFGKTALLFKHLIGVLKRHDSMYLGATLGSSIGFLISSLTELTFLRLWVVVLMFTLIGLVISLYQLAEQGEVLTSEKR